MGPGCCHVCRTSECALLDLVGERVCWCVGENVWACAMALFALTCADTSECAFLDLVCGNSWECVRVCGRDV